MTLEDKANEFMKEFSSWYDEPKTVVLHKEGWKNFHNQLMLLIDSETREARIKELEHIDAVHWVDGDKIMYPKDRIAVLKGQHGDSD